MERLEANLQILKYLEDFFKDHPYMRFNQALEALDMVPRDNDFYDESVDTLKKLEQPNVD